MDLEIRTGLVVPTNEIWIVKKCSAMMDDKQHFHETYLIVGKITNINNNFSIEKIIEDIPEKKVWKNYL